LDPDDIAVADDDDAVVAVVGPLEDKILLDGSFLDVGFEFDLRSFNTGVSDVATGALSFELVFWLSFRMSVGKFVDGELDVILEVSGVEVLLIRSDVPAPDSLFEEVLRSFNSTGSLDGDDDCMFCVGLLP
jgi:hypothetical protein